MTQHNLVLTVMSQDRPGVVSELSELLTDANGSWVESSMMSLNGKFAGILSATVPSTNVDDFRAALKRLADKGISVRVELGDQQDSLQERTPIKLALTGQDRPGLLAQLTGLLSTNKINIVELATQQESASMSGETLFIASCTAHLPQGMLTEDLQEQIENLADDLVVDITLET